MDASPEPRSGDEFGKNCLRREYVDRVVEAGGAPILIPAGADPDSVVPLLDGFLIPGGDDIDPSLWGDTLHPEARLCDPRRTLTERAIYQRLGEQIPVLGICYGCQAINVFEGGSLTQHLPDILGHDQHRGDTWQSYMIDPSSQLARLLGASHAEGKSWHHQAIQALAPALAASAHHEDGTVEAVEHQERPWVIGLQWHPERSQAEATPAIFAAFIQAAAAARSAKAGALR